MALTIHTSYAQIDWGAYSHSFPEGATDDPATVALFVAIRKDNNAFWFANESSKHFEAVAKDSAIQFLRPEDIVARTTFDTAKVHFFLHGVNAGNARRYEFRVVEYLTRRVIVPWKAVDRFTDSTLTSSMDMPRMAYLGGYKAQAGDMLIVDVRYASSGRVLARSLVAWEWIRPVVTNIYTSDNFEAFLKRLQYPWAAESNEQKPFTGSVPSTNTNIIFLLKADILRKEQVQYAVMRNGEIFVSWHDNDYDNGFVWLKDYPPGKYVLKIRYPVQPEHVADYTFTVTPAWYQSSLFRIAAVIAGLVFLGAFLFLMLFIQQRRKNRQELFNKTKLQLELKAVYAQLNPHFIFNALSSIQGLVNKQDLDGANRYLSDFARLMRESLNNSNKDEVSIHEEVQVLHTYLALEQLRFGFQYAIHTDEAINVYETAIPSLLLQPLVENAVKHGVSSCREDGVVNIKFKRFGHAMVVVISDNGKGMENHAGNGFGLKLTFDRIKLLNELKPEQRIHFEVNGAIPSGTQITLTFNYWFL